MRATMSILGLYNYTDGHVFDELVLPADVDREVVVGNILLECAELELIYPNPDIMKTAIGLWSKAELDPWTKLEATTKFVYNPIWNKDGVVTESEMTHRIHHEIGNEAEEARSESSAANDSTSTENSTGQVSAYDTSTWQNREKNDSSSANVGHSVGDSESSASRSDDRDSSDSDGREYQRIEQGNIGVTTTQQMIREEREVDKFHIDEVIVDSFKRRFCLLVY